MKNKETSTYTILKKVPYIIVIFICLFLIKYVRGIINAMQKSIPHDSIIDLAFKYMQTGRHELELGFVLVLILVILMGSSIYLLCIKFGDEALIGRILSGMLIVTNIAVMILSVWKNIIMFEIITATIFIGIMVLCMFSGLSSNEN